MRTYDILRLLSFHGGVRLRACVLKVELLGWGDVGWNDWTSFCNGITRMGLDLGESIRVESMNDILFLCTWILHDLHDAYNGCDRMDVRFDEIR